MKEMVKLILASPEKMVKSSEQKGVIIPAFAGNLTITSGYSPSMVWLKNGIVQLLNNDMKVAEKFFIREGVANIADDVCEISAEKVIAKTEITLQTAQEMAETAVTEQDKEFYQVVIDELTGFPKD